MHNELNKLSSCLLTKYYRSFRHPMKLRIFNKIINFLGNPRLIINYCQDSLISLDPLQIPDNRVLKFGEYEPEVWKALEYYANSSEIVWDIGAHIGIFSIRASESPKVKKVYSFEPHPDNFNALEFNNKLNNEPFYPINIALSNSNAPQAIFQRIQGNTGTFSFCPINTNIEQEDIKVNCITIDKLVFEENMQYPTLIKLDVEGWEFHVLQGAERLLNEASPKAIVFESSVDSNGNPIKIDLFYYLSNKGFKIKRLSRRFNEIRENENFIAVKVKNIM